MERVERRKLRIYQRQFLVNRRLQITFLVYSMLMAGLVSAANIFYEVLMSGQMGSMPPESLHIILPALFFIVFLVAVLLGLVLTNQVAGPIFRLTRHMENVAAGEQFEDLTFRKADFFSEVIVPYNKILARLRSHSNQQK